MERVRTAKHYWAITWAPIVFGIFALICADQILAVPDVSFRSSDSNWADREINFRDRDFKRIVYNFEGYKIICKAPNATLFRTTQKNWLNIFAWPNYFEDRKWFVPYAPPDPKIGNFHPHPEDDKHCYNGEWTPKLLEATRKKMDIYLRALDLKVAASRK